jgi:hypothetical protein
MKKVTLGSALAAAILSSTAMAADFHALSEVQAAPAPIQDKELSATEGGATCSSANSNVGNSLCAFLPPGSGGRPIIVTPTNPGTSGPFLQITR